MRQIQISSVLEPLDDPELLARSLEALALAQAMGLLPDGPELEQLDLGALRTVAAEAGRAGIGARAAAQLASPLLDTAGLRTALATLIEALQESPLPAREWASLVELLGADLLAGLLGISASSVRRYASGARRTPDEVAMRLHFLATVVADLLGTYNAQGVRRWFDRPRAALGGRSPRAVLRGAWSPEDEGPRAVRALAHALTAGSAT